MWFVLRMLRISWTARKLNGLMLKERLIHLVTLRSLINRICKRQATFFRKRETGRFCDN